MLRSRRFPMLLVACLLAFSAFADEYTQVHVSPRLPTDVTPIEFRYPTYCGSGLSSISRSGNVISIRYSAGPCSPPIYAMSRVPLPEGTLEPGQYRVDLIVIPGNPPHPEVKIASTTFTVRPAEPQPFRVRPSAAFHAARVRVEPAGDTPLCPSLQCVVLIGGREATDKELDDRGNLWVTTPPLAPGVYDVTIARNDPPSQPSARAAFYVFNESSAFDATQFERVLLPLYFEGPGAHGSQWITEQVIANPRPWAIPTGHLELSLSMAWFNRVLEPRSYYTDSIFGSPHGFGLLLPRADADDVAIAIRVRDVSREAEGFGTEIPAVRERNMAYNTSLSLLDVPLDPRYRAKLRVYAFLPEAEHAAAIVTTVARGGATQGTTRGISLRRNCEQGQTCAEVPLYAEVDFEGVQDGRIDVHIDGPDEALTWGFITVTNNDTQQVTTVTPSGYGGAPAPQQP